MDRFSFNQGLAAKQNQLSNSFEREPLFRFGVASVSWVMTTFTIWAVLSITISSVSTDEGAVL
jgi:hypothetical protein